MIPSSPSSSLAEVGVGGTQPTRNLPSKMKDSVTALLLIAIISLFTFLVLNHHKYKEAVELNKDTCVILYFKELHPLRCVPIIEGLDSSWEYPQDLPWHLEGETR